ncbi:hypothetical protein EL22_26370 [Halostagnicola sp. A56]|uniref:hypothetical protein n=1 Tax=Halostagnicola sp. A56 TaxID=1495067 RepID=UPI00065F6B36|nr:hypothetical protein [Halostagnicola sp. A56]KMT45857.1 hypothetical protein EL22_26370 [Halostagnicola sp. A56]
MISWVAPSHFHDRTAGRDLPRVRSRRRQGRGNTLRGQSKRLRARPESILTRAPASETAGERTDSNHRNARGDSISLSVGKRLIRNFCELAAEYDSR